MHVLYVYMYSMYVLLCMYAMYVLYVCVGGGTYARAADAFIPRYLREQGIPPHSIGIADGGVQGVVDAPGPFQGMELKGLYIMLTAMLEKFSHRYIFQGALGRCTRAPWLSDGSFDLRECEGGPRLFGVGLLRQYHLLHFSTEPASIRRDNPPQLPARLLRPEAENGHEGANIPPVIQAL